jgi:hypothetical protein
VIYIPYSCSQLRPVGVLLAQFGSTRAHSDFIVNRRYPWWLAGTGGWRGCQSRRYRREFGDNLLRYGSQPRRGCDDRTDRHRVDATKPPGEGTKPGKNSRHPAQDAGVSSKSVVGDRIKSCAGPRPIGYGPIGRERGSTAHSDDVTLPSRRPRPPRHHLGFRLTRTLAHRNLTNRRGDLRVGNIGLLAGNVAVVTGGSSGMAVAGAKLFAEEGAHVFITGGRKEAVDQPSHRLAGMRLGCRLIRRTGTIWTARSMRPDGRRAPSTCCGPVPARPMAG